MAKLNNKKMEKIYVNEEKRLGGWTPDIMKLAQANLGNNSTYLVLVL